MASASWRKLPGSLEKRRNRAAPVGAKPTIGAAMPRFNILLLAFVLVASAAPAPAQTIEPRERLLTVTGEAEVRAAPDMAAITLGVVSEATSAREALSANNGSMGGILEALRGAGIEPRDLQTSGFSVSPIYSQPPVNYDGRQPFKPEILGYRVSNNVTARIRDLGEVGTILDMVVTLGANSISGPDFTVADPAPLEDEARRAAVAEALRRGALYADAAGVALGPVFRIEEGFTQPPQPLPAAFRMEAMDSAAVPIEGGEISVRAQVSISWLLAD
jgi:uncharacterized protein YggE